MIHSQNSIPLNIQFSNCIWDALLFENTSSIVQLLKFKSCKSVSLELIFVKEQLSNVESVSRLKSSTVFPTFTFLHVMLLNVHSLNFAPPKFTFSNIAFL